MSVERRLVFGRLAELYDRYRPSYPAELIDDLVALAGLDGSRPVLEAGAGTGKATVLFAARGIPVVAIEPSPEMAAVARRNVAGHRGIEVFESDFETWDPAGRAFPLLYSAQAWHWVEPETGFARARAALDPRGVLAVFWNRPVWSRADVREELVAAYAAFPEMERDGVMHPANLDPDAQEDWEGDIAAAPGLGEAEVRYYDWSQVYSSDAYTGLLSTISELELLPDRRRGALIGAVRGVIDGHGGSFTLPMTTRVCLARRAG
jgi:SAM-dependent methyltransferase